MYGFNKNLHLKCSFNYFIPNFMSENAKSQFNYRIYYEHTDAGGVVYHARYLNFFERARTDWLRQRGIIQSQLQSELNIVYALTTANIQFKKPARMDDAITVSCQLHKIKNASVEFTQEMYKDDGTLLATLYVKVACIDVETFKVIAIPQQLKQELLSEPRF